jgi:hypothetical protein
VGFVPDGSVTAGGGIHGKDLFGMVRSLQPEVPTR